MASRMYHFANFRQAAAGKLLGIAQPKVSALLNGRLSRSAIAHDFRTAAGGGYTGT